MTTKDQMAINRGIDEVLNETEIGGFIARHKILVISVIILAIGGVLGYGIKSSLDEKKHVAKSALIFSFVQGPLKVATEKKTPSAEFVTALKSVIEKNEGHPVGNVLVLNAVDLLLKNKKYQDAIDILTLGKNSGLGKNAYLEYLFSTRMAVAYEDLGDYPAAIKSLETLLNSSAKILEGKLYLDLGRLYKKTGNIEKARTNFKYVVENSKQADFLKMAKLYLGELEQ